MTNLANDTLGEIKTRLEHEKETVSARIDQLSAQDPFSDTERLSDNAATDTEASEESTHDRYAAMVEELTLQVASIDTALMGIAGGTYGTCVSCGNLIDVERLKIVPTATLCLPCEQKKS